MTDDDMPSEACPNCGSRAAGRWCHACGQDNLHRRLSIRDVFVRTAGALADLDSTLWRTLIGLTRSPGRFAREYVDGRRAGRFPPFRYLLVTFAISMLAVRLFPPPLAPATTQDAPNAEQIEAANQFLLGYLQIPLFLAIPVAALCLRGLYHRTGRNYAECCILLAYTLGHVSLLGLALLPIGFVSFGATVGASSALQCALVLWASRAFFQLPWWSVAWRTVIVLLVYVATLFVVAGVMVIAFSFANA